MFFMLQDTQPMVLVALAVTCIPWGLGFMWAPVKMAVAMWSGVAVQAAGLFALINLM